MYTFDVDEESAMDTYHAVCDAYCSVFDRIGVPYEKGKIMIFLVSHFHKCKGKICMLTAGLSFKLLWLWFFRLY